MKWVIWCNYKSNLCAWARFRYKGKEYNHAFSGLPKATAMKKAYEWVLAKKEELGQPILRTRKSFRSYDTRKNNKLPVGVIYCRSHGYWYIRASASLETRKVKRKIYNIRRFGLKKAIRLATIQRRQWEQWIQDRYY